MQSIMPLGLPHSFHVFKMVSRRMKQTSGVSLCVFFFIILCTCLLDF